MNDNYGELENRLNKVLDRMVSDDFLQGRGLGNEISFYVFDYPPACELTMREFAATLESDIQRRRPGTRVSHINLFELMVNHLTERKLLDKSLELQQVKGDAALKSALAAPLKAEKLAQVFTELANPQEQDLVLVSGVGSVYPMLRSHSLLNSLHAVMGKTPLVLFFPGAYDGQALRLFNRLPGDHYYRAFKLIA